MSDAVKGDLVQIERIVLEPGDRPRSLPASTRAVPYQGWIKGFLADERADIGDRVTIQTLIGRSIDGTLTEVNPVYDHGFGRPRPELLLIGDRARAMLRAGKERA